MIVNGIILAAGLSSRMQGFKPLMKIGRKTMIELVVDQMIQAGLNQIILVLGYRGEEIQQVLTSCEQRSSKLSFVYNDNYQTTQMLDSIKLGLEAMGSCDWFFVTPGDMPAISITTYLKLIEYADGCHKKVLFPLLDGYRKHPPLISYRCKSDILESSGMGLRALWANYEEDIMEVSTADKGCMIDVDVREDYNIVCHYLLCNK